jgi:hypothetical protein
MSEVELRREFNWDIRMHLARVITIMMVGFFFRGGPLIVVLLLALSYVEIYPMRALRFFGGTDALGDDEVKGRD